MKRVYTLYYLLIVFLILGTFAAMAQNYYGQVILGLVAFVFGLVFSYHAWYQLKVQNKTFWSVAEPICLALIAVILGLRVFYIYFAYAEIIFVAAGLLLLFVYLRTMLRHEVSAEQIRTAGSKFDLTYYGSILAFLCSLIIAPFYAVISFITGIIGFLLLLIFIGMAYRKKTYIGQDEVPPVLAWVRARQDHSTILLILFFLFSLYQAMIRTSLFPAMYNDEMPQVYDQLIQQKGSSLIQNNQIITDHDAFKEAYDQLVKRHPVEKNN